MTAPVATTAPAGPATLTALAAAVAHAQASDPFARVVVIADHPDAARSVLHWLGAQNAGMINVTVQTGRRLAAELAADDHKTLPRTLESHAVRLVAASDPAAQKFDTAGRSRFYRSLAAAFREMAERPEPSPDTPAQTAAAAAMNALAETLHAQYRRLVKDKGYCIPADLPQTAADSIASRNPRRLPYVIYYLPRRLSAGDVALAQALRAKGKSAVIAARTGDRAADAPISRLLSRLDGPGFDETDPVVAAPDPLQQRAAAGRLSLIAAPDPDEEVRAVIRRIASDRAPFHRTAVIYRQANPYDSLLRQELDFANIPYAGVSHRSLGDTPTGRLLQGIVDLAPHAAAGGPIDRERLIAWLATTPVRWPGQQTPDGKGRTVPATAWANLAREARANGPPSEWQSRLNIHQAQVAARMKELRGDDYDDDCRLRQSCADLHSFISDLSDHLRSLDRPHLNWATAAGRIKQVFAAYRCSEDGETDRDRQLIAELIDSLSELGQWDADYAIDTLREAIREGLQSPVSARGQSVGDGVYIGPPAGIAGANYYSVYAVGMVERQFPPRPDSNPWLADNPAERRRAAALERYDFLAAIAAAHRATLCWPAATAARRQAYPSRWLVEAANLLHQQAGGPGRLAYDSIAAGAGSGHWLALIPSRQAGLAPPPASNLEPADLNDYRLMHLAAAPQSLSDRSDARMRRARDARNARSSDAITQWDGKVPAAIARIANIATRERPISPGALETWAACPYRYFLSRILGLSALPAADDADALSALDRGNLVHKILKRFVDEGNQTPAQLLALAEQEFENAVAQGIAGHHLLWEMEKAQIREGLTAFLAREKDWLSDVAPDESRAEVAFDGVKATVDGLGEIWFRGYIDRLDVLGSQVLVRDFKTGRPEPYLDGTRGRQADRTVANGQALQLPVYAAAAQAIYPDHSVSASYCFPLASSNTHDVATYTNSDQAQSDAAISAIVGSARAGIFPATPDGEGSRTNCRWCDFNRLCPAPARRRQIWEHKGRRDPAVQPYNALGGKAAIKADGH